MWFLAGRRQEMKRFELVLNKLTKYHEEEWCDPTCVVVEGPLGMGKTHLLEVFKVCVRDAMLNSASLNMHACYRFVCFCCLFVC